MSGKGNACRMQIPALSAASVRQNGGWGNGVTAATLGTQELSGGAVLSGDFGVGPSPADPTKVVPCAQSIGTVSAILVTSRSETLSRIAPYGLRGPGMYRLTSALRRTFDITERAKFIFGVDCQNVTNTVTFGNNASNNQIGVNVEFQPLSGPSTSQAPTRAPSSFPDGSLLRLCSLFLSRSQVPQSTGYLATHYLTFRLRWSDDSSS